MSTVHTPKQFDPQGYEIIGYFDNRRPQYYFGMSIDIYERACKEWQQNKEALFKETSPYRCGHCGNSNVRYVVAVEHISTGERVCFGDICVARLNFPNQDEFRASQIRENGKTRMKREKIAQNVAALCEEYSDLKWAVEHIGDEIHSRNSFAHDVIGKLHQHGKLSNRQIETVIASMRRDYEYKKRREQEAKEKKGPAPEGRQTVIGTVISLKWRESPYGTVLKMTVKLENNSRVWISVPSFDYKTNLSLFHGETPLENGEKIKLTGTFTVSKDDPHFAFGKRPRVTKNLD